MLHDPEAPGGGILARSVTELARAAIG
jgi:hypothetical protein